MSDWVMAFQQVWTHDKGMVILAVITWLLIIMTHRKG